MLEFDIKPPYRAKSRLKAVKVDARKKIIPKHDSRKPRWWRVSVGKKFTGTSKQRRFFETEAEANKFIRETEGATRERGQSAFDIPQSLAVEAIELSKQLASSKASLTDAVRFFLKNAPLAGKKTVSDLIPIYLRTKKEGNYRDAQEIALGVFARDFGTKPIASIFAPALEKWFQQKRWNPLNESNYMRDLSMFFRWAEVKDYAAGNPFDKITRPKVPRKTPEIFTVEEAEKLLGAAFAYPDLGLLPMYALGFFAGIRIEELIRMKWEMIDWDEREIRLPGEITKTGEPRNPDISPTLKAALCDTAPSAGEIVSPINLRLRRKKLHTLAGVTSKRNALRHSFATYHAAKYRKPQDLQVLLGQETPSVLFKHYITAVRKKDAERFFMLLPPYAPPKEATADAPPV
jgi:integrase